MVNLQHYKCVNVKKEVHNFASLLTFTVKGKNSEQWHANDNLWQETFTIAFNPYILF